jgi:uncharacterized repeat protein (TIGR04052 family)
MKHTYRFASAVLLLAALAACGDDSTGPAQPLDVTVEFAAVVNGAPFQCGQTYAGVGSSNTDVILTDFRLYVSAVELIDASGEAYPLELEQDGLWQRENLTLLDFEDGTSSCGNGTAGTNTSVRGTAPAGDYTGLRFTLGVPESLNHGDQTTAAPPLDLTALFWSWNGGYKFARMDHTSAAQPNGWNVHLGSTGCTPSGDPTVPATSCANPHRPTITFDVYDWELNEIVADFGALVADSDLTQNTNQLGCMSFPGDPDCPAVMNNFGLDYEGSTSGGQKFFSLR